MRFDQFFYFTADGHLHFLNIPTPRAIQKIAGEGRQGKSNKNNKDGKGKTKKAKDKPGDTWYRTGVCII